MNGVCNRNYSVQLDGSQLPGSAHMDATFLILDYNWKSSTVFREYKYQYDPFLSVPSTTACDSCLIRSMYKK